MPDDGANAAGQRIRRHECGGEHHHDQHEVLEEQGRRGGLGANRQEPSINAERMMVRAAKRAMVRIIRPGPAA